ncbi:MAG TPA: CoA-binding protein, partial [Burkholderiales bacterium]|nr:CoA-binding protein [Burkholderiales bacterium]
MSTRNLEKIFNPQRIAVIGASDDPASAGNIALRNLVGSGFRGVVYPVNAELESVLSIQAYPNVASLPKAPDLALVCTPAASAPQVVRECGEAGILGLVIAAAGFRETGDEGKKLEEQIRAEAAKFDGLRIVGPNSLGIMAPPLNLNLSFATAMPPAGRVAFVSQSGALSAAVLDWARQQGIGLSYFVSIGNMIDVDFGDLIDYFGSHPHTHSILLYLESLTHAREFMSAARAFARSKPIVACKVGRFTESAKAAASHTGEMVGEDAAYDAAFQRAGIVRAFEIADMFDCAELLGHRTPPKGPRLAIITNAGGPGVMAADALLSRGGTLAQLSDAVFAKLNTTLPPHWSHDNPIDILGDATSDRFVQSIQAVATDSNVDAILVILTPQAATDPT